MLETPLRMITDVLVKLTSDSAAVPVVIEKERLRVVEPLEPEPKAGT